MQSISSSKIFKKKKLTKILLQNYGNWKVIYQKKFAVDADTIGLKQLQDNHKKMQEAIRNYTKF